MNKYLLISAVELDQAADNPVPFPKTLVINGKRFRLAHVGHATSNFLKARYERSLDNTMFPKKKSKRGADTQPDYEKGFPRAGIQM